MKWSGAVPPHEMRRALRVRSKGSIYVRRGARGIRGRIVDLADSGLRFRANDADSLGELVGQQVALLLGFDDGSTELFALHGHVVRASSSTALVAIELSRPTPRYRDRLSDEMVAATAFDAAPHVLFVAVASEPCHAIADAFRDGGCEVSEVSTPVEAIAELDRARFEPGVIAIADTMPESLAEELRAELRRRLPHAHMVAIGRSSLCVHPASSWLNSRDTRGDLAIRVGRVITAHAGRQHPQCQGDRRWRIGDS